MALVNIGSENQADSHYRYKMPRLATKIEGRGNGIKTNLVNNVEVAKALERPPEYVLKYFGCELGAQTKFDKKSGNSIVNGAHDAGKLTEILETFIKRYVQCYSCGNPETVVKIKRECILLKCKACGFVSEVDPLLKLNTFIIKNPPEKKLSKAEKKVKSAEKERMKGLEDEPAKGDKEEKKSKKKKSSSSKSKKGETNGDANGAEDEVEESVEDDEDEEAEDDDEVVWMTDTSEQAMKARAEAQLSAATAALVTQGNVEAEREAAKRREEAAKKQAEEEAAALAKEADAKLKLAGGDANIVTLRDLVAAGESPKVVADALSKANISGGPAANMRVLYESLFGLASADQKLASLLETHASYLAPHAKDPAGQLAQLVAVEHLLGVTLKDRVKETPLVLKAMYDADLAAEELILAWYHKANAGAVLKVPEEAAQAVRKAAAPFAEWLEEAESDESEEDSD